MVSIEGAPLEVNESDRFLEACVILSFNASDLVIIQVLDQPIDAERKIYLLLYSGRSKIFFKNFQVILTMVQLMK